jgi:hypothetical protein
MSSKTTIAAMAIGLAALTAGSAAQAFNMGNMMNPSRWFNDNDRYDRYDRSWGGPYGGGYGPYGWGGPYGGYGGPYGGWGGPYGYGGYPGAIVVQPQGGAATPPPPKLPE